MKLKVKNKLNKTISIKLLNNSLYKLKSNEELIIGSYSECSEEYIFSLINKDLYVCKIIDN